MKTVIVCALLMAGAGQALAQSVWRCGPDGRQYSDTPCRDGRAVSTPDDRPAADVAQAHELATREKALAEKLVQERQAREARSGPSTALAAGIRGSRLHPQSKPAKPAVLKPMARDSKRQPPPARQRLEDADTWRATAPSSRHTKG